MSSNKPKNNTTELTDKQMIISIMNGSVTEKQAKEHFGDDYNRVLGMTVALPHSNESVDEIVERID